MLQEHMKEKKMTKQTAQKPHGICPQPNLGGTY